jgi:hypothetical protein
MARDDIMKMVCIQQNQNHENAAVGVRAISTDRSSDGARGLTASGSL